MEALMVMFIGIIKGEKPRMQLFYDS